MVPIGSRYSAWHMSTHKLTHATHKVLHQVPASPDPTLYNSNPGEGRQSRHIPTAAEATETRNVYKDLPTIIPVSKGCLFWKLLAQRTTGRPGRGCGGWKGQRKGRSRDDFGNSASRGQPCILRMYLWGVRFGRGL